MAEVPETGITGVSHIDLSVSNRERSADWYRSVLGFEIRGERLNERAGVPWVHLIHPGGVNLALVQHPDNDGAPFDERRSGLDHLSFAVATGRTSKRSAVSSWRPASPRHRSSTPRSPP